MLDPITLTQREVTIRDLMQRFPREQFSRLYTEAGSKNALARVIHISQTSITALCSAYGLPQRGRGRPLIHGRYAGRRRTA